MRNGTRNTDATAIPYYVLPIDAHVSLQHTRDELRLLAQLTEGRSEHERDEIVISADALADTFNRFAEGLDGVLGSAQRA